MKGSMLCCLLAVCWLGSAAGLRYKDCGSSAAIKSVTVTNCSKSDTCDIKRGTNATIAVTFTTAKAFKTAKAIVHGILDRIPVPFPIANPDGCKDSGITCPVKAQDTVTYHADIYVKKLYPKVKVVVKFELQDESKNDIFCVELPAEIVDNIAVVNQI